MNTPDLDGRRKVLLGILPLLLLLPVFLAGTGVGQVELAVWAALLVAWLFLFRATGRRGTSDPA